MVTVNHNYLKLPGSYLFSTIAKKVKAYKEANPQANVISLGIGDVTQPLAPAIVEALHKSVDEMGDAATFHGYAPDLGYEFLRSAIAKNDYKDRGCDIKADEIFVSDGAKSDSGNIQEIFGLDNKIAVCDPVYPVYVDTNGTAVKFVIRLKSSKAIRNMEDAKISIYTMKKIFVERTTSCGMALPSIFIFFTAFGCRKI